MVAPWSRDGALADMFGGGIVHRTWGWRSGQPPHQVSCSSIVPTRIAENPFFSHFCCPLAPVPESDLKKGPKWPPFSVWHSFPQEMMYTRMENSLQIDSFSV